MRDDRRRTLRSLGIRSALRPRTGSGLRASGISGRRAAAAWRRSMPRAASALPTLVRFARTHSPAYRDAYRALPERELDPAELPIVTKRALMARFDDWVTDPELKLTGIEAFLADRKHIGERYLDRYVVWKSSGSTGTPGIYVQDADALATFDALMAVHLGPLRFAMEHPWEMLAGSGRAALVAATGDHFASIASWRRVCQASPWVDSARILDHGSAAAAGGRPERVSAVVSRELSDDAGAPRRGTERGTAEDPAAAPVVRRRMSVTFGGGGDRARVRMPRRQRIRRVGMHEHRVRMHRRLAARQCRLGAARACRRSVSAGACPGSRRIPCC